MGILQGCLNRIKECIKFYCLGKSVKVCVAGPPGSGKTAFCKAFISGVFDSGTRSTAGMKPRKFAKEELKGVFYDIGGGPEFQNLADFYYRTSNVLLFFLDSTNPSQFDKAKEMLRGLLYRNRKLNNPILVLCTHNDLENSLKCKDIVLNIGLDALLDREVACYSISSTTQSNFDLVLAWLQKNAK